MSVSIGIDYRGAHCEATTVADRDADKKEGKKNYKLIPERGVRLSKPLRCRLPTHVFDSSYRESGRMQPLTLRCAIKPCRTVSGR